MARILRGLSSRTLPCGCLLGIYETYGGGVIEVIDAKGAACFDAAHVPGSPVVGDRAGPDGPRDERGDAT